MTYEILCEERKNGFRTSWCQIPMSFLHEKVSIIACTWKPCESAHWRETVHLYVSWMPKNFQIKKSTIFAPSQRTQLQYGLASWFRQGVWSGFTPKHYSIRIREVATALTRESSQAFNKEVRETRNSRFWNKRPLQIDQEKVVQKDVT